MHFLNQTFNEVNFIIFRHFLVRITVKEPIEIEDDVFVKYLIVFKKWLAIEEMCEEKEEVRYAFNMQAKPKKSLW